LMMSDSAMTEQAGSHAMALLPDLPPDETLRALGLDPRHITRAAPVDGGLSGARLTRLWLAVPAGAWPGAPRWHATRIVKEQIAESGWIASSTHDARIREAALWQTGFARRLPRRIVPAVERVMPSEVLSAPAPEATAALLMRDMRARLMRDPYQTPPGRLPQPVIDALDALAVLHARFWNAPTLDDPRLGLASLRDTMLWLSPAAIEEALAAGLDEPYLWLARRGWEAFFRLIAPEDAETLAATLAHPDRALAAIARLPRTLVHGDVWGPNLGRLPPTHHAPRIGSRVLLIDWALVAAAPATWDPIAMCGAWHTLSPVTLFAAYRARLTRRLAVRGFALSPKTWRLLVASAYLRAALSTGEAYARAVEDARGETAHRHALARLRWWARRGARGARLLEGISPL
jgi:hypothetical protein